LFGTSVDQEKAAGAGVADVGRHRLLVSFSRWCEHGDLQLRAESPNVEWYQQVSRGAKVVSDLL
jgi:hypothetical protein